jgi:imidazoleglycerol-phosphate dehydratase|tara:strand:+ start:580 stop:1167 length:588 start_codon:yes stop_codon:yes gene_type:complete
MRKVVKNRDTSETQITVDLNLDGTGQTDLDTGLPFLDHMLDQIGRHGMIDLSIKAKGDLHIDDHHTIEDIGITLGEALNEAVGDKKGIRRYGHAYIPLDEALSRVVLDFSGRPGLFMKADFVKEEVGNIDVNMFEHFFQSLSNHAFITLHIENLYGENAHHQIETIFKAFGRALRMALEIDSKQGDIIPSTKGAL